MRTIKYFSYGPHFTRVSQGVLKKEAREGARFALWDGESGPKINFRREDTRGYNDCKSTALTKADLARSLSRCLDALAIRCCAASRRDSRTGARSTTRPRSTTGSCSTEPITVHRRPFARYGSSCFPRKVSLCLPLQHRFELLSYRMLFARVFESFKRSGNCRERECTLCLSGPISVSRSVFCDKNEECNISDQYDLKERIFNIYKFRYGRNFRWKPAWFEIVGIMLSAVAATSSYSTYSDIIYSVVNACLRTSGLTFKQADNQTHIPNQNKISIASIRAEHRITITA